MAGHLSSVDDLWLLVEGLLGRSFCPHTLSSVFVPVEWQRSLSYCLSLDLPLSSSLPFSHSRLLVCHYLHCFTVCLRRATLLFDQLIFFSLRWRPQLDWRVVTLPTQASSHSKPLIIEFYTASLTPDHDAQELLTCNFSNMLTGF